MLSRDSASRPIFLLPSGITGRALAHHNTDENGDCKLSSERGIAEEARITIFVWVGLARSVGVGPSDGHGSGRTQQLSSAVTKIN